jgi:RHS repeat-associated protein
VTETDAANGDRFKFAGMQFDATTQQYYDHARWYVPGAGRFIGLDPDGFAARDSNLYRYVGNDVTATTDPSGEFVWWLAPIVAGGAGAIGGALSAYLSGGNMWAGACGGAVTGVLLTCPPPAFLGSAVFYLWPWLSGAAGGAINSLISQLSTANDFNWEEFGATVAISALIAGATCNVGATWEGVTPGMVMTRAQEGRVLAGDFAVTFLASFLDASAGAVAYARRVIRAIGIRAGGAPVAPVGVWSSFNSQAALAVNVAQPSGAIGGASPGGGDEYWFDPIFATMSSMIAAADRTMVAAGVPAMPLLTATAPAP